MRLRFEDWMIRKGLTCQKIVESGVSSELELLDMADRLGVLPPVDLQEFNDIWATKNETEKSKAKPANSVKKTAAAGETKEKSSTTTQSKTGARTTRRKSTRKKTNIKDDNK